MGLLPYLKQKGIEAEIVAPGVPMPTVDTAAQAVGVTADRIIKSLLFEGRDGDYVLVVANGNGKVDTKKLTKATGMRDPKLARPEVVLKVTGYPAGGTPPVGHRRKLRVVMDQRVAALDWGYAGGGKAEVLLKIRPADIIRLTDAEVHAVV